MQKPQHEKRTLLITAVAALALAVALFAALGYMPFGPNTVLTGDLNGQYTSYFAHFRTVVHSGGNIAYGMDKSLGGSMLGILAYYCNSPFNVLYLLAPVVYYPLVASFILAAKIVLACLSAAFFFGRRFPAVGVRAVLPALGYGFCAYVLVYAQNIMWHDVVLLAPLVCYGIYKLVVTKRPFVFSLSLALALLANFYIGYMLCFFSVLYFGFEMLLFAVPAGQRARFWGTRCGVFALGSLCAGALCAVLILPSFGAIAASKGLDGGGFGLSFATQFPLLSFFRRLLPGSFEWATDINCTTADVTGLPNVYCGVLAVVLTAVYFAAENIRKKEKILSAAMTLVLFASMYCTDFMLSWHGFTMPVWFPYRNSFLFSLWILFLASRVLAGVRIKKVPMAVAGGVLLLMLVLSLPTEAAMFTFKRWVLSLALVLAYSACWWLLQSTVRLRRALALCAALVLTIGELLVNNVWGLRQFEIYPQADYQTFVADGTAAVAAINEADGTAFRIEKTYFRSLNDDMLLGYYGISHFGSTQDETVTELLHALGYTASTAELYGEGSSLFADSVLSIKYVLVRAGGTVPAGYEDTGITVNDITVYRNPYALPMVYPVAQSAAKYTQTDGATPEESQNTIWRALSGQDNDIVFADDKTDTTALAAWADSVQNTPVTVTRTISALQADITLDEDSLVLFSVPLDEAMVLTVDGKETDITPVLSSLCGAQLTAGTHQIELHYRTPQLAAGILLSLLGAAALIIYYCILRKKEKKA